MTVLLMVMDFDDIFCDLQKEKRKKHKKAGPHMYAACIIALP